VHFVTTFYYSVMSFEHTQRLQKSLVLGNN